MKEFSFIQKLQESFDKPSSPILGIGDDCAVFPIDSKRSYLISTDSLVENVHFILKKTSACALAKKSLIASLSDISAMGGTPRFALCSISVSKDISEEWLDQFSNGLNEVLKENGMFLIGGDTTSSHGDLFINIAVIGDVLNSSIKKRSTIKTGDYLVTPGMLGASLGGLESILEDKNILELEEFHNCPSYIKEIGEWLGGRPSVTGMMDISDGIASDIKRFIDASEVGFDIYLDKIPIHSLVHQYLNDLNFEAHYYGYHSGEEYQLLFTVKKEEFEKLKNDFSRYFEGRTLHLIGEAIDQKKVNLFFNDMPYSFSVDGEFKHF